MTLDNGSLTISLQQRKLALLRDLQWLMFVDAL